MKTLFSRVFYAVVATTFVLVLTLSTLIMGIVGDQNYSQSVRMMIERAKELAGIMESTPTMNMAMQSYLGRRINSVGESMKAPVWIVNASGIRVYASGESSTEGLITFDELVAYLPELTSGKTDALVMPGAFDKRLNMKCVSVGVPYHDGVGSARVSGVVIVNARLSDLTKGYGDMLPLVVGRSIVALMAGMVISWVIAQSIARPVRSIARAAHGISKGDFSKRVHMPGRKDEVGQLAAAFNDMATELEGMESVRRAFVANVSHELRSPMTSVQGYVQGMLDGVIPPEDYQRYLGVVNDECKRLTSLISDLLDLSRIEGGNVPLHIQPFDINELIRRVLIKYEGRIEGRHQGVTLRYREPQLVVEADAARIEQVLSNLVDNACKFASEGGHITVSTYTKGAEAVIAVSDDGPGIASEDLPYVFDRFYKADKSHSGQGTGLGLSITQRIVEQHGQQIVVRSEPGHGATFAFTLKAAGAQKNEIPLQVVHGFDKKRG